MRKNRKLARSHDAMLGGVCAGVADCFYLDVAAVRIVVVVATLLSSGLVAVGYAVLWLILPDSPDEATPVDVAPEQVHSETYGTPIDPQAAAGPCEPGMPCSKRGTGHIPPRPPHHAAASSAGVGSEAGAAKAARPSSASATAPSVAADSRPTPVQPASVRAMLLVGLVLVSAGAAALFSSMFTELSFGELWPLSLLIAGILFMVVPTSLMARGRSFSLGLSVFFLGVVLLAVSTGALAPATLNTMLMRLWPVALVIAGLLVLGRSLDEPWFAVAGGVVFAVACIAALVWYGVPGDLHSLTFVLPGKTIVLPSPWA